MAKQLNITSSLYECGKCSLSKEDEDYLIKDGRLDLVAKYNHLFEK